MFSDHLSISTPAMIQIFLRPGRASGWSFSLLSQVRIKLYMSTVIRFFCQYIWVLASYFGNISMYVVVSLFSLAIFQQQIVCASIFSGEKMISAFYQKPR